MMESLTLHHQVSNFLAQEAELLDLGYFDRWLDLFADDGIYWILLHPIKLTWKDKCP